MDRSDWDERYQGSELVWTAEPNRFLPAEVASLAPGRALDLACGEGRNALWLAERGWRVTAVDFSAVGLAKAAALAEARHVEVAWIEADLANWVPPEAGFDLVIVFYLHLPADERRLVLARAAAAAAPGGTVLVVGHDLSNLDGGYGGPQDPSVLTTPADLAADLDGLTIEKAELVHRTVQTADGERTAIDNLVRAVRRTLGR